MREERPTVRQKIVRVQPRAAANKVLRGGSGATGALGRRTWRTISAHGWSPLSVLWVAVTLAVFIGLGRFATRCEIGRAMVHEAIAIYLLPSRKTQPAMGDPLSTPQTRVPGNVIAILDPSRIDC
ncbi:uncharacterized protein BO80DRAFT_277736 [Aspergillus ibericus CBS 121593]|uniref:Uncharacterized protein n=1 Tax=Aspergillus ibericus CBS 121593 TaxID=1448316 RepID=A0A395GIC7_9EURO|nr:hypothetical protein BO80DRAFT_277736 [Aspergillus ibericus CBS 121593]RAK95195.1 hypothetical protein BO80DRAFT_277736 [Aspergillus ibericus CBS 121593]